MTWWQGMVEREKMERREQESANFVEEQTSQRCVQHMIKNAENASKETIGQRVVKVKRSIKQRRMLSSRSLKMRSHQFIHVRQQQKPT